MVTTQRRGPRHSFEFWRRKFRWSHGWPTSPLSREPKSRVSQLPRRKPTPGGANVLPAVRQWACGGTRAPEALDWRHVPDRAPAPQSHPWPAVDRKASAAALCVLPGEAEHCPPPGDGGGEPLLAEHSLS